MAVEVPIVGDAGACCARCTPIVERSTAGSARTTSTQLAEWRRESEASSWHGSGAWRDGLPVGRLRHLAHRRAHEPRRDAHRRRRPEPDVAGALRGLPPAELAHLSSGGLGTMGFSMPAAMGAALGRPDKETWAIAGDGGFQMTFQELMTLVQDRIPVKIALMDNKKLGMIRQWQEIIYGGNYHSATPPRARLPEARRRVRHPGLGASRQTRSMTRSAPPRRSTARRWSGSRSPRSRTSSR